MTRKAFLSIIFAATVIALLMPSCKKFDGSQTVPAYLYIKDVEVQCDYFTYGANTHKIVDAWVYVDDNILGCYELPATIPVLKEGEHKVAVYAGIARDGIRSLRAQYPFYAPWEKNINLVKDEIVTLEPVFTYYPAGVDENMHVCWMEDFDGGAITVQATSQSDTSIMVYSGEYAWHDPEGIYSQKSGKVVLTSEDEKFRIANAEELTDLPTGGSACMLEMDYKCSDTCFVGLMYFKDYTLTAEPIVRLKPTGASGQEPVDWNKIYINIGPYLVDNETAEYFKIYFGSWDPRNTGTQYFYFDNLKLIYRDR